ncbi:MAG TPA: PLP-dependent aminotransferase family protein [Solirubrobacteraceae bacterium]|nr:PLP-dependent aminotransferase family protein [Solirubrobacteraceae bacterium]
MSAPTVPGAGAPAAIDWERRLSRRAARQGDAEITAILALAGAGGDMLTFSGGFPAPETFAADVLAPLAEELIRHDAAVALQYSAGAGVESVRAYLRDRVAELDGRRPEADELIVTSGGIECMDLVAKSLIDPGDDVVLESPTYLGAIMGFRGYDANLHAIPMDEEGLRVDVLAERLRAGLRPKLVYVIPDHQNPTGLTLSVERRAALVELCRRHGICILEDVAYRELDYEGRILPSLWSLAPELVVQAGTFSKVFFPGVRLGWAAGPARLIAELGVAKQNTDQCAGAFGQRLLEAYGRAGHFGPQLERARALYARRWRLTDEALRAHMPEGTTWTRPRGGFFTWLTLPGDVDTADLRAAATAAGVAFVAGRPFYADGRPSNAMRLAFSRMPDDRIEEGVRRLASVLR